MYNILNNFLKLTDERLMSGQAFIKLVEKDRSSIESAKFIPPTLGSNSLSGRVRVKLKPGHRYATK
ncbi:hypothetical protein SAMN05661012_00559 [Chitinophaga sancti]|uniref:Uncharacterized protein n=1 Tax=Chitinophaga sancti TaxID=1004 RepID=A0A1K1MGK3_9BACT|nr:hypothetical protein SAMN05661012_00559 [Chitinophaga sancti]